MIKLKGVARRIVSFTLRKLFNPLYRRAKVRGFPWAVSIYSFLYRRVTFLGLYEPGTVVLLKELLKEGMTFLDLGAYRGYYTVLASKLVGEKGRVFAFEPAPENFALLKANLQGRKNVSLIQKAVSNKVRTGKLFLASFGSSAHRIYDADEGKESVDVEVTSLDEFFKDKDAKIDVIKMDIEGAEMSALEGMANIIKKNENLRLITEFVPWYFQPLDSLPESFLRKLVEYGFKLYLINDDKETVEPVTIDDLMRLGQDYKDYSRRNLFCEKGAFETTIGSE